MATPDPTASDSPTRTCASGGAPVSGTLLEYVDPPTIDELWKCPVCGQHFEKPVMLRCGHNVCRRCLPADHLCPAPGCGEHFDEAFPNPSVQRLVQALKVRCVHTGGNPPAGATVPAHTITADQAKECGPETADTVDIPPEVPEPDASCEAVVTVGTLEAHLANECPAQQFPCPQCGRRVARAQREAHLAGRCPGRQVACPKCQQTVQARELMPGGSHLSAECPRRLRECTLGCGQMVPMADMEEHCRRDCKNKPRPCLFAAVGCPDLLHPADQPAHSQAHLTTHVDGLRAALAEAQARAARAEEALQVATQTWARQEAELRQEIGRVQAEGAREVRRLSEGQAALGRQLATLAATLAPFEAARRKTAEEAEGRLMAAEETRSRAGVCLDGFGRGLSMQGEGMSDLMGLWFQTALKAAAYPKSTANDHDLLQYIRIEGNSSVRHAPHLDLARLLALTRLGRARPMPRTHRLVLAGFVKDHYVWNLSIDAPCEPDGIRALGAVLEQPGSSLPQLTFSSRSPTCGRVFGFVLEYNTTLQALTLSECPLGEEGTRQLASGLARNHTLTYLALCRCHLGEGELRELASSLAQNHTLTRLFLHDDQCHIGDAGACVLAAALTQGTALEELNLSYYPATGEAAGVRALEAALERNPKLKIRGVYELTKKFPVRCR
ncbi:hypothetical protein PAPYR_8619 [Paratrimastix pyriformis]|uniref:Uncharacterized protein n=1 Tax=Paratrimastix pyriformis TaxID=342808 RepID=A0ABQ8UBT7_9EUKA|nr:hypothetical protein PAPYR_8619 [Paratrimastix pyriformis]